MFKPPIQSNMKGGQLQSLNAPCATAIRIEASPTWYQNNAVENLQQIADSIIFAHYNDLSQFVFASRQMCFIGGLNGQHTARNWGDLRADFSYNFGMEALLITVLPDNTPQPTGPTTQSGNTFTIDIPFLGLPVFSMGTASTSYLDKYQIGGPQYFWDQGFSPNDPGNTSQYSSSAKAYTSQTPDPKPDLADADTASVFGHWPAYVTETYTQATDGTSAPTITYKLGDPALQSPDPTPQPDGSTAVITADGISEVGYCKGVAGSAILTTPLSGKQYWEVQIKTMPRAGDIPPAYTLDTTGYSGSKTVKQPNGTVGAQGFDVQIDHVYYTTQSPATQTSLGSYAISWLDGLDAWNTPTIGVAPSYYLPKDLQSAGATATPKPYMDYTRCLGLDKRMLPTDDAKIKARSIYAVSSVVKAITYTSPDVPAVTQTTAGAVNGIWEKQVPYVTPIAAQPNAVPPVAAVAGTVLSDAPRTMVEMQQYLNGVRATAPVQPQATDPNAPEYVHLNAGDMCWVAYAVDALGLIFPSSNYTPPPTQEFFPNVPVGVNGGVATLVVPQQLWAIEYDQPLIKDAAGNINYSNWHYLTVYLHQSTDSQGNTTYQLWTDNGTNQYTGTISGSWQYNEYLYELTSITASSTGPTYTASADPASTTYTHLYLWGGGWWAFEAASSTLRHTAGFTWSNTISTPASGGDKTYYRATSLGDLKSNTDGASTPDFFPSGGDASVPAAITGVYEAGSHTPIYIGRVDQLNDPATYGDGHDLALDGSNGTMAGYDSDGNPNIPTVGAVAKFTGVDLGPLVDGDTVMIATDAATGCIWFGKNGKWYAPGDDNNPSAPIEATAHDGPSYNTKWAAVMDGGSQSVNYVRPTVGQANPNPSYYPAVGFRKGPFKAVIIYDAPSLKYAPPSGFKVYGQAATV